MSIANLTNSIKNRWSIFVVVATFCNFMFFSSVLFNYNLLYIELKQSFNASNVEVGIPGAVSISLFTFGSPLITVLFQILGHRITVALGVSLCCLGLLISSFAQKIVLLYVTYGVMYGLGFNACNLTCTDMVLRNVQKRNATRATCTIFCAVGIGFLLTPCFEWLYATYSWRVSFRILSSLLAFIGYPTALMMVEMKTPDKNDDNRKKSDQYKNSINSYWFLFRRRGFNVGLLGFIFVATAITFTLVSTGNFLSVKGMDIPSVAFVMFVMGVGDVIGRITAALCSDRLPISRTIQYAICASLVAIPTICLPFILSHKGLTGACIAISVPRAFLIVLLPTIAMELSTDNTRAESIAAIYLAFGLGSFITPYLTDAIYDQTGSYDFPWYICTGLYALTTVCMLLAERARKNNLKTDRRRYNLVLKDNCENI